MFCLRRRCLNILCPYWSHEGIPELTKCKTVDESLERFHKMAKRRRESRRKAADDQLTVLRGGGFKEVLALIEKEFEEQVAGAGEEKQSASRRKMVQKARQWINDTTKDVIRQIESMSAAQKAHILKGNQRYEEDYCKIVETGGDHVSSGHGLICDKLSLDYVDEWVRTVHRSFSFTA